MRSFYVILILLALGILSCQPQAEVIQSGLWRAELQITEAQILPFRFELSTTADGLSGALINEEESLTFASTTIAEDSVFLQLAIFDSEIRAQIVSPTQLSGTWYNHARGQDYQIPFQASLDEGNLFPLSSADAMQVAPTWEAHFSPEIEEDYYPAIGKFEQQGQVLSGTFLTETGDYRYLSGAVDGNKLMLSTFDGSHAFLFEAEKQGDSLVGTFYSGNHFQEPWVAIPNPNATLRAAESLTYLKEGYDKLAFTFPNLENQVVSLSDKKFQGKAVVVQIMGSWCPNCMDETKLFSKWYEKYSDRGLEFVALAFEYNVDESTAFRNLKRLKDHFKIGYEILLASTEYDKEKAAEKLPMLNHIMSYPTSIWIDRSGKIRKIHTGFNGPGTGAPYEKFVKEYSQFIEEMLAEG